MGKEKTQFKPGESGNPKGRPKGSNDLAKLRGLLTPSVPELVEKAKALALDGDVAALRLCLERVLPPLKAKDEPIEIEALKGSQRLTEQGAAVINAMANGEISPSEASLLMKAVSDQARIIEIDELEKRVVVLEGVK